MINSNLRVVLWDIGGVLTESPIKKFLSYEKSLSLPPGSIIKINSNNPMNNAWAKLEKGLISKGKFSILFKKEAKSLGIYNIDIPKLLKCLELNLNEEMVKLLKLVSKNYNCVCLTNNFKNTVNNNLKRIEDNFSHIFESSKLGMRKPEKKIYKHVLKRINVEAERVFFIDDLGINLKPAREIGILTYKFIDSNTAIRYIKSELNL